MKIKNRNMVMQVLLIVVTFGIYGIYWFYETANEMKHITKDADASPVLWTILLFVPFGVFYSHYCHAELYEKIASEKINRWIIYILWLFFSPAVWFLVQRDLNALATKQDLIAPV